MIRRGPALALVAAMALAGCDSDRRAISRADLPEVPTEPAVTVELGDDGFDPSQIEVSTEDVVEFINTGDDDHGVRTDDWSIDTGLLLPGESTVVMFDEEAAYEVLDVADDSEAMTVVATAPAAS